MRPKPGAGDGERSTGFSRPRGRSSAVGRIRCIVPLLTLWLLPGCADKKPEVEIVSLEGKITRLERTSDTAGTIGVLYYSEKQKQEIMGLGEVTGETEIMINGAIARLADLKEGDRVRGEVRVVKHKGERKTTALKIYVDRPTPVGEGD